eukprot:9480980-Pyramimonas_sp.AAC.1
MQARHIHWHRAIHWFLYSRHPSWARLRHLSGPDVPRTALAAAGPSASPSSAQPLYRRRVSAGVSLAQEAARDSAVPW